eukprot:2112559-Amphidinium_carterae.1
MLAKHWFLHHYSDPENTNKQDKTSWFHYLYNRYATFTIMYGGETTQGDNFTEESGHGNNYYKYNVASYTATEDQGQKQDKMTFSTMQTTTQITSMSTTTIGSGIAAAVTVT